MTLLRVPYRRDIYKSQSKEKIIDAICKKSGEPREKIEEHVNKYIKKDVSAPVKYKSQKTKKKLTLNDYFTGGAALVGVVSGNTVNQDEIDRRSAICLGCKELEEMRGCSACGFAGKLSSLVNSVKHSFGGGYSLPNNLDRHSCGICKCSLAVILPSKIQAFKEKQFDKTRPDICWIRKDSKNFIQ